MGDEIAQLFDYRYRLIVNGEASPVHLATWAEAYFEAYRHELARAGVQLQIVSKMPHVVGSEGES